LRERKLRKPELRERERERGREMEDTESKFKRVCVFCGSSSGKKASYQEAAVELAKELVIVFIYVYIHTHTLHISSQIQWISPGSFHIFIPTIQHFFRIAFL
jgi:hypothetical protein